MARNCESITFSLPRSQARMIRTFREEGGNPSALIQKLITDHFGVGENTDEKSIRRAATVAIATERLKQIEEAQEELRQCLAQNITEVEKEAEERKKEEERKNMAIAIEKRAALEATIHQIFNEIDEQGFDSWRREVIGYSGNDAQFTQVIRVRRSIVASRAGISEEEARAAILRVYPDLEGCI